jgi:hypothetical protein
MTDGIVTTRPLKGLERVREKANKGERKGLGDWEHETITGMMSLQSGFNTDSTQTKMRGTRKAFIAGGGAHEGLHELLIDKVLPEWKKPRRPEEFLNKEEAWPRINIPQTTYITPASVVGTPKGGNSWHLAGRWVEDKDRWSRVHTIGVKRILEQMRPWLYWSCDQVPPESVFDERGEVLLEWQDMVGQYGWKAVCAVLLDWRKWVEQHGPEAVRCGRLVPSIPARNETPETPSLPAHPNPHYAPQACGCGANH